MIKVCHITSVHPQKDVRIFEKECVSLEQNGYEVHLVAPGKSEICQRVQIHGIGEVPEKRLKRMFSFSKKAYKAALMCNAELYHFHDPELIPYGLKLKKKGKRVIFDSHENVLEQFSEKSYIPKVIRITLERLYTRFLKYACSNFDVVISVDPYICKKYEPFSKRVEMITNYPQIEEIKRSYEADVPYIAFAGGVSEQWNHETVIKAISQIKNLKYILCGITDREYLEKLKMLPGWEKVDYRGKVTHQEALEILTGAVAGVALCSYSNNTNNKQGTIGNTKLFEIMMCGIPVICTDFISWSEIVEKNQCGICINPKDTNSLVDAIKKLLRDERVRMEMGYNGKKAIHNSYSWEQEKEKLIAIYNELLSVRR